MRGEKIYEYDLDFTGVTDYGVSMEAILSGKEKVPPQGARFDVAFEGHAKGRLSGRGARRRLPPAGCALTAASTLISERPSRLTTVTGSLFPPTAWACPA
jgi:hypothetical protein